MSNVNTGICSVTTVLLVYLTKSSPLTQFWSFLMVQRWLWTDWFTQSFLNIKGIGCLKDFLEVWNCCSSSVVSCLLLLSTKEPFKLGAKQSKSGLCVIFKNQQSSVISVYMSCMSRARAWPQMQKLCLWTTACVFIRRHFGHERRDVSSAQLLLLLYHSPWIWGDKADVCGNLQRNQNHRRSSCLTWIG